VLKSERGGEEVADLDGQAPPQQLGDEEQEGRRPPRRSPAAEGAAPPQRISATGEWRRSPGKATATLATELTTAANTSMGVEWGEEKN
jgi:hypothetical protein